VERASSAQTNSSRGNARKAVTMWMQVSVSTLSNYSVTSHKTALVIIQGYDFI